MAGLLDYNPEDMRRQSLYAGLLQLGPALMAAGQAQQNPAARSQALMAGAQGFGQGQQGYMRGAQQNLMTQIGLADAQRKEKERQEWRAAFGLPAEDATGTPGQPDTRTASGQPPNVQLAMSGNERPGPTPAAAGRLDMASASPASVVPPNLRAFVGKMGPERGSAFMGPLMAKNLETDNWKDEPRTIAGKEVMGQRSRLTGKWEPLDKKLVDLAVNPSMSLPPQETAEQKLVGEKFGKIYTDMQDGALGAPGKLAKFDRLETLLSKPYTGAGGESVQAVNKGLKAAGDALGLDTSGITDKVGSAEAAQALSNEIALEFRNPSGGAGMPGAMSDQDREFLKQMTGANLSTTPEGRKQILDTRRKLVEREKEIAKIARDYRKKNGKIDEGFFDELQTFSDKNPLFKGAAAKPPGGGWSIQKIN